MTRDNSVIRVTKSFFEMDMPWNIFYCTVAELTSNCTSRKTCLLHMFMKWVGLGCTWQYLMGITWPKLYNVMIIKVASTLHGLANQ